MGGMGWWRDVFGRVEGEDDVVMDVINWGMSGHIHNQNRYGMHIISPLM